MRSLRDVWYWRRVAAETAETAHSSSETTRTRATRFASPVGCCSGFIGIRSPLDRFRPRPPSVESAAGRIVGERCRTCNAKELRQTRRQGDKEKRHPSPPRWPECPFLLVSLSPCLLVYFFSTICASSVLRSLAISADSSCAFLPSLVQPGTIFTTLPPLSIRMFVGIALLSNVFHSSPLGS